MSILGICLIPKINQMASPYHLSLSETRVNEAERVLRKALFPSINHMEVRGYSKSPC